jgi:serine/threonine-protein kinase
MISSHVLKARQRLGKYRIERRLGEGGFAIVYQALDTIEGIRVALKIPHGHLLSREVLNDFRQEVRLAARLDHPNVLPLKNAGFIDNHFVIVTALGEGTLGDRLQHRMSLRSAWELADQMIDAVAYAHRHRIIHCDIKPDNLILFPENRIRLTDFGIARVAQRTVRASGSGTMGYIAPEQAMGRPSFRSDVFALGLILYRMFAGRLPEWPFDWPPPGIDRLRGRVHPDMVALIRRAIQVEPQRRYSDAQRMLTALRKLRRRAIRNGRTRRTRRQISHHRDWKTVRRKQFQRQFGRVLETRYRCSRCDGPVAESMQFCPWCSSSRRVHRGDTRFPASCPRCHRGMKLDWSYCPWCYGPGFEPHSKNRYRDAKYHGRCGNPKCPRKEIMPFMRYCPWCHRKVRRSWTIAGSKEKCGACGWGVVAAYWSHCPWCGKPLGER